MKTVEIINKLYTRTLLLSSEATTDFRKATDSINPEANCHLDSARGLLDAALAQIQLAKIKQN